jgi:hypothetical protein
MDGGGSKDRFPFRQGVQLAEGQKGAEVKHFLIAAPPSAN